jgi:transmembrane sensor
MSGPRDEEMAMATAEAAAQWFARLQDEAATHEDWLAFEQWLAASPAHASAYEELERIWVDLDDAAEAFPTPREAPAPTTRDAPAVVSLPERRAARAQPSRRMWLAAGAGLAASLAVGVFTVANWPAPTQTYIAAQGQTRRLTLADGTHVWLNAGSRLDVRLEHRDRRVQMAEGEAVFDVTHDPARPFLIDTGDREVRVVGTQFNLRQRGEAFALTVSRGLVEVRPSGAPQAAPTRVAAGQRLTHTRGAAATQLTATAPDSAFAWTRGQLVYEGAPLSEVAADLSRSLGLRIGVADAATGRIPFTGVLMLDDRAAVLPRLQAFAPIDVVETRDGRTLLMRRH